MEVEGGEKLQTDQAEASKPWYGHMISERFNQIVQMQHCFLSEIRIF